MRARGSTITPCILLTLAVLLLAAASAGAWDDRYRTPHKVRASDDPGLSGSGSPRATIRIPWESGTRPEYRGDRGVGPGPRREQSTRDGLPAERRIGVPPGAAERGYIAPGDWETAAGQSRREILCPKRDYALALGIRPVFAHLSGAAKALSRGGEGSFLSLSGHLRLPPEAVQWEFYSHVRLWNKVTGRLEYQPWHWEGPGHIPTDGNFAGLLLTANDAVHSELNVNSVVVGADYDVSFSRDLVFGPNADFHIIKWRQRVSKENSFGVDFSQTILQPAIGAHVRYEPSNTGYFSWFKPYLEGRFSWMSFTGLGMSTWDVAAGLAPPLTRNVDAGFKAGYRQWRIEGHRGRLFADVGVEGFYLDFALRF
jgi:hypothetical protein